MFGINVIGVVDEVEHDVAAVEAEIEKAVQELVDKFKGHVTSAAITKTDGSTVDVTPTSDESSGDADEGTKDEASSETGEGTTGEDAPG